jgi:hypothetical protein
MDHLVLLQGKYIGQKGFNIFTVQRDLDIFQEEPLIGGTIPALDGQLGVTFFKADILNTSFRSDYYIVIRKPEPVGGGQARDVASGDNLDLTALKIYTIYHPDILLLKKDRIEKISENAVVTADQRKIDDTIVLTKVPAGSEGNYLQFKNAYNADWRLVKLSESDWNTADSGSLIKKSLLGIKAGFAAFSSPAPVNVEYYSNAWKLDSSESVYAVVFLQEFRIKLLFALALVTVLVGLLRKKW